jgi:signal transduction histidine kinase
MISITLALLFVADVILVFLFYRLSRKQNEHSAVMSELTEERAMLSDMRAAIRDELNAARQDVRSMKEQMQVLAAEAEQEVRSGISTISGEIDSLVAQIGQKFDEPLKEMNSKQHYLEKLVQRIQVERQNLARTTERAGAIAKFFQEGVKFEDVIKDIEDKKFSDIRALIAQGQSPANVAREIGVSEKEVRFVAGLL